jgi:hypothetical protein
VHINTIALYNRVKVGISCASVMQRGRVHREGNENYYKL